MQTKYCPISEEEKAASQFRDKTTNEKHCSWNVKRKMLWGSQSQTLHKKSKLRISSDQQSEMFYNLLLLCIQEEDYHILKLSSWPFSLILYKVFLKNQKEAETSLAGLFFCTIFEEKCFSPYILLSDQISLSDCLYFLRYWAICVL